MGKVYVLRKGAEKHSRNFLLFSTIIIGSVFGLAACNNDANDDTPVEDNNNIINDGVDDGATNRNDTNGDGVIDQNGVENNNNNPNGVNEGAIDKNSNNNNGDVNTNNGSFKDEAENVIDETEDAIRGEDGNKKPE